jgi:hypothetical protein
MTGAQASCAGLDPLIRSWVIRHRPVQRHYPNDVRSWSNRPFRLCLRIVAMCQKMTSLRSVSHSMTLASEGSDAGIASPTALAVARLVTPVPLALHLGCCV